MSPQCTHGRCELERMCRLSVGTDAPLTRQIVHRREYSEYLGHRLWRARPEVVCLPIHHRPRAAVPRMLVRHAGRKDHPIARHQRMHGPIQSIGRRALHNLERLRPGLVQVRQDRRRRPLGTVHFEDPSAPVHLFGACDEHGARLCAGLRDFETGADHGSVLPGINKAVASAVRRARCQTRGDQDHLWISNPCVAAVPARSFERTLPPEYAPTGSRSEQPEATGAVAPLAHRR